MAKVSEKRISEWWEAPGIDGREAFDEEILFLNSLAEELPLPRWALGVRDLMPRWGFEPCGHHFLVGLGQVIAMIGEGRVHPRVGDCGEVPLWVAVEVDRWAGALLGWCRGQAADGGAGDSPTAGLDARTPERVEAVRAAADALLSLGRGRAALDEVLDRWADRARFPLARALVDGEQAPLVQLLRHPCCFNLIHNLRRLVDALGRGEVPTLAVCGGALREARELDPGRLPTVRATAAALTRWLQGVPPQEGFEQRLYRCLGPQDEVKRWLVASLYKCLKLWLRHLDCLVGRRQRYYALV
ncbi:MAG: hypothetical protein ACP5G2_07075 [Candidatus Bipolaricaulaceae bacterium]